MPRFNASNQNNLVNALANGSAVAGLTPGAAVNFKLIELELGVNNAGGTISDFQVSVGINLGTARGTVTTTAVSYRSDPNSSASTISGLDVVYSVQPTLAASDFKLISFNTRGTVIIPWTELDIISTVGTANPIVFVNRSGAALPANHAITLAAHWLE